MRSKPLWPFALNRGSPLAKGLIGYWPLDHGSGRALDLARGNHGVLTNFTAAATSGWMGGNGGGRALRSNGSSNYVAVNGTNPVGNLSTFTVSLWFKTASGTGADGRIYGEGNSADANPITMIRYGGTGTTCNFFHRDNGAAVSLTIDSAKTGLNDSQWHHVAAVKNGSSYSLYVDGLLSNASTASTGTLTLNRQTFCAHERTSVASYFNGSVEGIATHSRALTAAEVYSLWHPSTRWQLRYQVGQRVYSVPAGGGGGGGTQPPRSMHQFRMRRAA